MDKYSKGDYIHTIPLGTAIVKRRFRDENNKIWYKVITASQSIFYVPRTLTKGLATKEQVSQFKIRKKVYGTPS